MPKTSKSRDLNKILDGLRKHKARNKKYIIDTVYVRTAEGVSGEVDGQEEISALDLSTSHVITITLDYATDAHRWSYICKISSRGFKWGRGWGDDRQGREKNMKVIRDIVTEIENAPDVAVPYVGQQDRVSMMLELDESKNEEKSKTKPKGQLTDVRIQCDTIFCKHNKEGFCQAKTLVLERRTFAETEHEFDYPVCQTEDMMDTEE